MNKRFSVIIPLYNKEAEVGETIRSVLAQTLQPLEIVVVNDGSTDRSAEVVESIGSPLVKLINQPNAGECAARNRAMAAAKGDYFALIDADDRWKPGFLAEAAAMIDEYPGCGIYSTAFDIISPTGVVAAKTPADRGVLEDYWTAALNSYVCIPSASVIPAKVVADTGGFPEGMKMGGDQYMWIKIAGRYKVCFSPMRLCDYSMVASNRSGAIYRAEQTPYSFEDFITAEDVPSPRSEFVARCALGKAITLAAKGDTAFGRRSARAFSYTRRCRKALLKLRLLLCLPASWRPAVHSFYGYMAWRLAHKGL